MRHYYWLLVILYGLAIFGVIKPLILHFRHSSRQSLPFIGKVPWWNVFGLIFPITPRTAINGVGFWEQSFYMTPVILLALLSRDCYLWIICVSAIVCMTTDIKLYRFWGDRVRARACVPLCVSLIMMLSLVLTKLPNIKLEIILTCLVMWGLLSNKSVFPYEPFDKERYSLDLPNLVGNAEYRTNNLPYPWVSGILHKIRSTGYAGSSSSKDFTDLRGGLNGSHDIFTHTKDINIINKLKIKWSYGNDPGGWKEIQPGVWENPNGNL